MKNLINDFRCALGFITILPAGRNVPWSPVGMIRFFPIIGLILGGLVWLVDYTASLFWPPAAVAFIDVAALIVLTGAFHIDGLGDAADGLFSHRPKERVLEIMKDSRIGMMALVSVVCVVGLKTAGIMSLKINEAPFDVSIAVITIPSLARSGMLFGIRFLNYGRKDTGTGRTLFERPIGLKDFCFVVIPVILSILMGWKGVGLLVIYFIWVAGILLFYKRKLNCITGDMLGAMTEVLETVLFMAAGASFVI